MIEDNEIMRENTAEILELANYEVVTARNGKEGVQQAGQTIPDLIICDIMMPELDGYGVLHMLGKDERTASIPFIFLTAKAEKDDYRAAVPTIVGWGRPLGCCSCFRGQLQVSPV